MALKRLLIPFMLFFAAAAVFGAALMTPETIANIPRLSEIGSPPCKKNRKKICPENWRTTTTTPTATTTATSPTTTTTSATTTTAPAPTTTTTPAGMTTTNATTTTTTSTTTSPASATQAIYWGATVKGANYGYGDPPWDMRSQDLFEQHTKKKASLMAIGALWGSSTPNFQPAAMSTIRSHGSIPFFTWGPTSGGGAGADQPTYKLSNIYNGQFDAYITKFAQDAKAWGQPFFLRFMWEMNGSWYPWSEARNGNQPGDYVKAWRHVHDIFTQVGVTNATWVWCVNTEYSGSLPLEGLYPGDAYVDWMAVDGYNKDSTSRSFATIYKPTYDHLLKISSKPIIIGEVASKDSAYSAGTKAAWITDMLAAQLPTTFPRIKGFLWFNWSTDGDYIIESSATATAAFAAGVSSSTYASNTFATLTGTTIKPLAP
jgi:beta-mannanase